MQWLPDDVTLARSTVCLRTVKNIYITWHLLCIKQTWLCSGSMFFMDICPVHFDVHSALHDLWENELNYNESA